MRLPPRTRDRPTYNLRVIWSGDSAPLLYFASDDGCCEGITPRLPEADLVGRFALAVRVGVVLQTYGRLPYVRQTAA
jgi:hypothetical protein